MTAPESGDLLGQGQLRVARAGRQVDDHEIELAPLDVAQELVERLQDHRAAPDDGGVGIGDEAEGHRFTPWFSIGMIFSSLRRLRAPFDSEHHLLGRPVDVGIEKADGVAESAEGEGEIRRDRRLADASLPQAMATTNRVSLRMSLRATAPAIHRRAEAAPPAPAIVTDRTPSSLRRTSLALAS